MQATRRELIALLGSSVLGGAAAARSAWAESSLGAPAGADILIDAWRTELRARRLKVRELFLLVECRIEGEEGWSASARWLVEGRSHLFYRSEAHPHDHMLIHHRDGALLTELGGRRGYFQGIEPTDGRRPPQILREDPASPGPHPSLRYTQFLPALADRPAFVAGRRTLATGPCLIVGQGDFRYFFDVAGPPVVRRRERFRTASQARERIDYLEYETLQEVPFARGLLITRFNLDGSARAPLRVTVLEIALNEGLPVTETAFARVER